METETVDQNIIEWLRRVESKLDMLLTAAPQAAYTPEELSQRIGYAVWTICEWCRDGRLNADKDASGHWRISHEELERYRREGCLSAKSAVDVRKRGYRDRLTAGK